MGEVSKRIGPKYPDGCYTDKQHEQHAKRDKQEGLREASAHFGALKELSTLKRQVRKAAERVEHESKWLQAFLEMQASHRILPTTVERLKALAASLRKLGGEG